MKYVKLPLLFFIGLFSMTLLLSSCNYPRNKKTVLRHVVAFQFKENVSTIRQEQAINDFLALKDLIPEIKNFEGGNEISTGGRNKGFSHCFVLTFENEAARDVYLPHPAHMDVVNKNKPLFNDLLVLDYWGEE